jgi:glycosyltransferase involved in cell wall biosynthesis
MGHDVVVFTTASAANGSTRTVDGLPIVPLARKDQSTARKCVSLLQNAALHPGSLLHHAPALARAMKKTYPESYRSQRLANYLVVSGQRLDILHAHFAGNLIPLLGVGHALEIPVVVSLLGSDVTSSERYGFPNLLELVPQESDVLVSSSSYIRDEFRRRSRSDAPIRVLPPEVPATFLEGERTYVGTSCRLVTVARLTWKKGLHYAIHAARELKRRGVVFKYDIIGGGEDYESLEMAINDFQLRDRVTLHGSKDPGEILDYLRQADIFILPSINEGAGVVLLEAQATGMPVVSTWVGGIPETVREGKTGLLVPARDSVALADAVEKLVADPGLRERLGREGRRHASQFETRAIGSQLVTIYQSAIERQKQRGKASSGAYVPVDVSRSKQLAGRSGPSVNCDCAGRQ